MNEDTNPEFNQEFLREVDAIETAVLQCRERKARQLVLTNSNDNYCTSGANTDRRRAALVQKSGSGDHGELMCSDTAWMIEPELQESGEDRVCNGCNLTLPHPASRICGGSKGVMVMSPCVEREAETFACRWAVNGISVRDFVASREELIGQGELMIHAQEQVDGVLVILNAVVTAAGGGRAMEVPAEAISFLANGTDETPTASSNAGRAVTHDSPTLLLGLGIGCTIVLSGVRQMVSDGNSSNCLSSERVSMNREHQQVKAHNLCTGASSAALYSGTSERRELAPADFLTPSCPARSAKAGQHNSLVADKLAERMVLDPILVRLIDTNGRSVDSNGEISAPKGQGIGNQPLTLLAPLEEQVEHGESVHEVDPKNYAEIEAEKNSQGDADTEPSRNSPNSRNYEEADGNNDASNKSGDTEIDVPDDEWRRPLMVSPPNRRRAAAGRRQPKVRNIPHTGPVLLALGDCDSSKDHGDANPEYTKKLGGKSPVGRGMKRPRVDTKDSAEKRGQEASSSRSPGLGKQAEISWLALRLALHERYREFQEDGAAQASAAEAIERAGTGTANTKGDHGELLSPGLRVFHRQGQAFAYADAVAARLAPQDAVRYKVLSFETNSTGSRKFLVCDFRRFEEQYPYVARPDRNILHEVVEKPPTSQHAPQSQHGGIMGISNTQKNTLQSRGGSENQTVGYGESSISRAGTLPALRHVYEIIREGAPCRMYFDLEFARGCNEDLDGDALVRAWINVVAGKLQQDLGISVGPSNFLDLDSSTPRKFSRHLILHLPGDQLFEDNSHVGRFVNALAADLEAFKPAPATCVPPPPSSIDEPILKTSCHETPGFITQVKQNNGDRPSHEPMPLQSSTVSSITSTVECQGNNVSPSLDKCVAAASRLNTNGEAPDGPVGLGPDKTGRMEVGGAEDTEKERVVTREESGALERLWVYDGDGRRVLFADVSVYTRNRCFRLLGSSKYGKTTTLTMAGTNERSLELMEWKGGQKREARDVARTVLHDSLVVPAIASRSEGESFLTVGGGGGPHRYSRFGQTRGVLLGVPARSGNTRRRASRSGLSSGDSERVGSGADRGGGGGWHIASDGFASSPFPAVDDFLRSLVCRGGVKGDLRQWSYTASESTAEIWSTETGGVTSARRVKTRLLTHQVSNNRWCFNIGRAHKSNHIFLVTDLSQGEVRQHCHDQDCRRSNYRSPPIRLPTAVAPSSDDLEAYELSVGLAVAMKESPADWTHIA